MLMTFINPNEKARPSAANNKIEPRLRPLNICDIRTSTLHLTSAEVGYNYRWNVPHPEYTIQGRKPCQDYHITGRAFAFR